MRTGDWIVMCSAILFVVVYSIIKSRGRKNIHDFVLSGQDARWFTVALSVMATQASAITFISTPGQAFVDGMRFVQFYFGLPLAMIVLCITVLPIYRRLHVYTAYEYLEKRFDLKTRSLAAMLFLTQRSLAAGLTIYAPSLVLSLILGWNISYLIISMGCLVILYTTFGGTKAVSWAQSYQILIIFAGMFSAFVVILMSIPVSLSEALSVAGVSEKLNAITFSFDFNNRYTLWSGLLGGFFLQLSYFGTDQSQVQRYLTGNSLTQSRLGLIFNGLLKIPMQISILFLGVMLFVFYQFTVPPLLFNSSEPAKLQGTEFERQYQTLETEYARTAKRHEQTLRNYLNQKNTQNEVALRESKQQLAQEKSELANLRGQAALVLKNHHPHANTNDTNYIFLSFVITYLPVGLVGLVIAAILSASMSSCSSEINALASTGLIDVYKRLIDKNATEQRYLLVTRLMTVFWGIVIIIFAQFADKMGSLIEAVNILGSLFYGTILGIFLTAFYLKFVGGTAVFFAALLAEVIVIVCFVFTNISFLWYNLLGCVFVMVFAALFQAMMRFKNSSQKIS